MIEREPLDAPFLIKGRQAGQKDKIDRERVAPPPKKKNDPRVIQQEPPLNAPFLIKGLLFRGSQEGNGPLRRRWANGGATQMGSDGFKLILLGGS